MLIRIRQNIEIALLCVGVLWIVHFLGLILPHDLQAYGIMPRTARGLFGLATAPFLHAGLDHLLSNSLALAVLLSISLIYSRKLTLEVVVISALLGGGFVWLFGTENSVHIGASGIIFGLIGFLLAVGLFRSELLALVVSVIITFYYGYTLFSLFLVLPGVSWSAHFFGFASGVLTAWLTRRDTLR